MADILQLVSNRCDPRQGAFLRALADLSDQGQCPGVTVAYRTPQQQDQFALFGSYKQCPWLAANAISQLRWHLEQQAMR